MSKLLFISDEQYNRLMSLSYTSEEVMAFAKMLAYFTIYWYENPMSPQLHEKFTEWAQEAAPLIAEIKIKKQVSDIINYIERRPKILPASNVNRFGSLLMALRDKIYKDRDIKNSLFERTAMPAKIKTLLTQLFSLFNGVSQTAYGNIQRNINVLKEPLLNNFFVVKDTTVTSKLKKIISDYLVGLKTLTGKNVDHLTLEQRNLYKKRNPGALEHITELQSVIAKAAKIVIQTKVRSSGEHTITSDEAREVLKEHGIPTFLIPVGFDGLYDDAMNMYLKDGRPIPKQIGGWMKMVKNPEPGGKVANGQGMWVATEKAYRTLDDTTKSKTERHAAVRDFIPVMPAYVKKWRNIFDSAKGERKMLAAMAELIFITAGRIGSIRRATDKTKDPSFGISVLKAKHVIPQGNKLKIVYEGKKNIEITHVLTPTSKTQEDLINYLKELKSHSKPNDFIFRNYKTGEPLGPNPLRDFFKNPINLPEGITAHKFRHARGTDLFLRYLEANEKEFKKAEKDKKSLTEFVQALLTEVGTKLGHMKTTTTGEIQSQWRTAATNYVDPSVMRELYEKNDYSIPTFIPNINTKDDEDD